MKRIVIKKILPKTVFKAVLMAGAIPYMIFLIFGIISVIINIIQNSEIVKIMYTIYYLILVPIIYGLITMLLAASYNWLAAKFGGLEIDIEEKIENKEEQEKAS